MIVKGTKQLGSFKRGINLYVPKKVVSQAEPVIWKVAIYGAGTTTSNGEYVWDGTTTFNGKPKYENEINFIYWYIDSVFPEIQYWSLFDDYDGQDNYSSNDLITWTISNGQSPAPSSALSYAQDSFINGFELDGDVAQTYSRASGGNTTFTSGEPELYVMVDGQTWFAFNESISGEELYNSQNGGFTWEIVAGDTPVPNISAITYSA